MPWVLSEGTKFHFNHGMVSGLLGASSSSGTPAAARSLHIVSKSSERKHTWCTYSPRLSSTLSTQVPGSLAVHNWIDTPVGLGFWNVHQRIRTPSCTSAPSPSVTWSRCPGDSTPSSCAQSARAWSRSRTRNEMWSMKMFGMAGVSLRSMSPTGAR